VSPALSDVAQLGSEVRNLAAELRLAREAAGDAPAVLVSKMADLEPRLESIADRLEGAESGIVATTAAHVAVRASQNDPHELASTTPRVPEVQIARDPAPRVERVRALRRRRDARLAGVGVVLASVLAIVLERLAARLGVLP
jgi:hypothetical protein